MITTVAAEMNYYPINLAHLSCDSAALETVSEEQALNYMVLPLARMVSEVRPNRVAVRPISMRSPWTAELTKFISEMYLVTARPLQDNRLPIHSRPEAIMRFVYISRPTWVARPGSANT